MRDASMLEPLEDLGSNRGGGVIPSPFPQLSPSAKNRLGHMLRTYFSSVWRLGRRMGLPSGLAEEVAQESFVIAARRLHDINPGCERAYLYGVALRLTSNARRSRAMQHEISSPEPFEYDRADPHPTADQLLAQKQQRILLDQVLASMSQHFREALVLFEIEGCSVEEIAEALGVPEGTAASRLRRAREDFSRRVQRLQATIAHSKEGL